jgi:trigger factor
VSLETLKNEMTLTVESPEACSRKLTFTISEELMVKEEAATLKSIAGMVAIPGFRKGKAPAAMVRKRYAENVKEEMSRLIISAAFEKTSADEKLDIISYRLPTQAEMDKLDTTKEFSFDIIFDIAPEIKLPKYKGLKVDVSSAEVDDKVIDERIAEFRDMYAEFKDIETEAQEGDMLEVAYSSDFELPEDASASLKRQVESEKNWLWLSKPETIPGTIAALTGVKQGEERKFDAVYPEDWRDEELQGKTVKYTVTVVKVQRRMPLKSDEELCKKMQLENIEALRSHIATGLNSQAIMEQRNELREAVYEQVADLIGDFELPPAVLAQEVQKVLRQLAGEVKDEAAAEEFKKDIKQHQKEADEKAKAALRRMFILRKIANEEKITVEQAEVDAQIKSMSKYYRMKEKELRDLLEKNGTMEDLRMDILCSKVADYLADQAEITEKDNKTK